MVTDRIEIDAHKCHGRPVIRGTRVTVSIIAGSLAGGMSMEEVVREYDVTIDDIRAALAYLAQLVDSERHFPIAG